MSKRFLTILATFIITALAFAACGSGDTEAANDLAQLAARATADANERQVESEDQQQEIFDLLGTQAALEGAPEDEAGGSGIVVTDTPDGEVFECAEPTWTGLWRVQSAPIGLAADDMVVTQWCNAFIEGVFTHEKLYLSGWLNEDGTEIQQCKLTRTDTGRVYECQVSLWRFDRNPYVFYGAVLRNGDPTKLGTWVEFCGFQVEHVHEKFVGWPLQCKNVELPVE